MRAWLIFLIIALCPLSAVAKKDREIHYLGGDRYSCSGRDCEEFNARERQFQARRSEERSRRYTDEREARQRERDQDEDDRDSGDDE